MKKINNYLITFMFTFKFSIYLTKHFCIIFTELHIIFILSLLHFLFIIIIYKENPCLYLLKVPAIR
jgi:hypothetical protein